MTRDQQRLADYLNHILEAIERIHRYVEDIDEVAFLQNDMIQVVHVHAEQLSFPDHKTALVNPHLSQVLH